ncbi:RNA polymerase sigma factor [Ponticaulis sp.]|jgi:RNA polymerase sigma-70 factor (ECF subfamily)|uniref:RNA polymerase sigma factor n=1 Tax=Ponticaulis sp. TaxID=2020902 RepID=UPI000C61860A|nr:RNA polymerase sigma factor [Ponticaulis sp.]MBN02540.1 RNA polymerase subunit sigma-24 [Ponticaulis sp.]|tara:strand:+ start:3731 stop:4315 length:585 start_codon:yes stop_codon:yes gene_type:complete
MSYLAINFTGLDRELIRISMQSGINIDWQSLSTAEAEQLRAALKAFIQGITHDTAQADDIYQETLLRTGRSTRFSDLENPLAYMITVAKSVLYDFQRKRTPNAVEIEHIDLEAANDGPELTYIQQQKLNCIEEILNTMTPLRREVFILRRVDGLTRDEIANRLDLSVEAVKKHLTRAMVELTIKLEAAGWTTEN